MNYVITNVSEMCNRSTDDRNWFRLCTAVKTPRKPVKVGLTVPRSTEGKRVTDVISYSYSTVTLEHKLIVTVSITSGGYVRRVSLSTRDTSGPAESLLSSSCVGTILQEYTYAKVCSNNSVTHIYVQS